MSNPKCAACNKTAYPLESVTALERAYHKGCFKCNVCNSTLNLKNFKGVDGKIFCFTHTPKPAATAVTDSLAVKQALNAPKKSAEGLGHAQKGTGEKPKVGLDTVVTRNAMKAPRKEAEGARGVQKGPGGKPQIAVFGGSGAGGNSAPEYRDETEPEQSHAAPAHEEPAYEEEPAAEPVAEEAPQESEPVAEEPAYEYQEPAQETYEEQPQEDYGEEQQQYSEEQPAEEQGEAQEEEQQW